MSRVGHTSSKLSFWCVYSTHGVHCSNKAVETDGHTQGYKDPPIPRRLVGESQIPPGLSPPHSRSSENMLARLAGPADLAVQVSDRFTNSHRKASSPRPTSYETHTVASQNNWRVPELLEKVFSIPRSFHPHLQWWMQEDNVLTGQPLYPIKHALQIFTDASNEGWDAHLDEHTTRGTWSLPEGKLHINYLEPKAVFLALKEFQDLCSNKTVLVATNDTTVVSYINKEGGMRSGPLCALLWRILTWRTKKQVTLKV